MHPDEQRAIQRRLSAGEWFGGLPAELQHLILSRSLVRKFGKGQVISVEESAPKGLFAVLEGNVHLVREIGAGAEALIHVAEPGFWFGEFGILTGRPTLVTAVAYSRVQALYLPKAQFEHIVAEEPRYYREFARLAFDRYAELLRVFVAPRGLAPEERLRGRLAAMAHARLQDRPQALPVPLAVSQADLARMVGVSRQTLNALLGKLEREGMIELGFRSIRVLDPVRLASPDGAVEPAAGTGANVRRGGARETSRASSDPIG